MAKKAAKKKRQSWSKDVRRSTGGRSELELLPEAHRKAMDKAILRGMPKADIVRRYIMGHFPGLAERGARAKLDRYIANGKLGLKRSHLKEEGTRKASSEFSELSLEVLMETIEMRRALARGESKYTKHDSVGDLSSKITEHMEMAARLNGQLDPPQQDQNPFSFSLQNVIVTPQAPGVPLVEGEDEDDIVDVD